MKCDAECEVYSRVCGYFRPVKNWNRGKQREFFERKPYAPLLPEQKEAAEAVKLGK